MRKSSEKGLLEKCQFKNPFFIDRGGGSKDTKKGLEKGKLLSKIA